jgi:Fic family protein
LSKKQPPKNRPEGQVLGYRDALAKIHTNYNNFEINTETILKMHKDMLKYTDLEGGIWKVRDNTIEERLPNGQWVTRFQPVSAIDTPFYMNELCNRFRQLWLSNATDPLILIFAFIFDFLCIHPFSDGNGRMSRLLTVLLLHKINVDVTRYISYERLIEDTKEQYYEILREVSKGWHHGQHRLSPWLEYNIGLLIAAFKEL